MKKIKLQNDPGFRELNDVEMYEYKGGLCILPMLLGQKAADWLMDRFGPDSSV